MIKIKHSIQEFIKNRYLVIVCYDIKQLRTAGKFLWPEMLNKLETWKPFREEFPMIAWYAEKNNNFNLLGSIYTNQIAIEFEDVIFTKLPEKWIIKFGNREQFQEINNYFNGTWLYENDDIHSNAGLSYTGEYYSKYDKITGLTIITFKEFEEHILKREVIKIKEDYNYLITFLKKLNIK